MTVNWPFWLSTGHFAGQVMRVGSNKQPTLREPNMSPARPIGYCELCGRSAPLRPVRLRIAWANATTGVNTCAPCGAVAWLTVDELIAERESAKRAARSAA